MIDTAQAQQSNRRYIRRVMQAPLLTREREIDLVKRWRDASDEHALHELIESYSRVAVSIAMRYRRYGLPVGDLIQEGNIGLLEAAKRFDADKGVRFATYANWWVRAAVQDYVLRNWSIVRTGTTSAQKSLFFNLRRLRAKIAAPDGPLNATHRHQIAKELNVRDSDVAGMESRLSIGDRSLNAETGEGDGRQWQDLIESSDPNPEEVVVAFHDEATRAAWLNTALAELNDRERTIIEKRRLSEDGATLESLGHDFGISKERVRQIEGEALKKLRNALVQQAGDENHSHFVA